MPKPKVELLSITYKIDGKIFSKTAGETLSAKISPKKLALTPANGNLPVLPVIADILLLKYFLPYEHANHEM